VYVFYSVFLSQNTDLEAQRLIRTAHPQAYCIFCGPQATFAPEAFLAQGRSFAVRGEPDFLVRDLVRCLKEGGDLSSLRGISYAGGDGVAVHLPAAPVIERLDDLPVPDRTLLDHSPYYNPKLRHMPHTAALTSRGCFGQCWYCVPNSLSYARELEHKRSQGCKPPVRIHSAARMIEEFREIARQGFRSVSIIDDQFLWDEERTLAFCEGIRGLGLEWSCLARPERVTERAALAMKAAGCAYVDMGTESFDPKILAAIKKDISPDDTRRAVSILKKAGIEAEINVLLGATDLETEDSIKATIREVKKLNAEYVLFSIANPFPGTEFYSACKSRGWLASGEYTPVDPAKSAIISYPHLSKAKLEKLCAYAYTSYYFSPRYLWQQLKKVKSPRDLFNKAGTAARFFAKLFFSR
jgi:anaerobic magnesium-protoporphyrin IX monomethyl ester cyclase